MAHLATVLCEWPDLCQHDRHTTGHHKMSRWNPTSAWGKCAPTPATQHLHSTYIAPTQHLHSSAHQRNKTYSKEGITDCFPKWQLEVNSMRSSLDTMVGPFKCRCGIPPLPVFRAGFLPVRTQLHTDSMCSFSLHSSLINQSLNS